MKILNLYAGIGGNRNLWGDEHEITAVELVPEIAEEYQKRYPKDKVVVADAHQYLLDHFKEFDFIWSSPVCKTHSNARFWSSKGGMYDPVYVDFTLYQEIIFLQNFFNKGLWCVENVIPYYKPLIRNSFRIGRHIYWSNFGISWIEDNIDKGNHNKQSEVERNTLNPIVGKHILDCSQKQTLFKMKVKATRVEWDFVTHNPPPKRINAFRGGARSSKTHSILSIAAKWLATGWITKDEYHPKGKFFILRATMPALRASAYKEFTELLHDRGVYKFVEHKKTETEFYFQGRLVRFFSTDDLNSEKLRGQQSTFFYLNEANTISYDAFNQLIMRCEVFCFLDYNPAGIQNWCKTHIEETRQELGDVRLDVSTYNDNPFLPDAMVTEIENYKNTDPDIYQVYTQGNWIQLRNLVFPNTVITDEWPEDYEKQYFGLDFGWNDPTTCVEVLLKGDDMYIRQMFYEQHLTIPEMADAIHACNVRRVYCDHEPRTIQHLKTLGVNARKAKKGRDSIDQGLTFIRQHKIHLYHKSQDLIREFTSYRYKEDRDGEITDKPMDKDNHTPDAVRMAVSRALRTKLTLV